jgi:hypothetical protein
MTPGATTTDDAIAIAVTLALLSLATITAPIWLPRRDEYASRTAVAVEPGPTVRHEPWPPTDSHEPDEQAVRQPMSAIGIDGMW